MTSRRSQLDESGLISPGHTFVSATGSIISLADETGAVTPYTDLMSAYGAVNFGHRNPEILADMAGAPDLVACFYPAEADWVAGWICDELGLRQHRVLFQVGGSFAVATALALAQRHRAGAVVAVTGSFHGLGAETLSVTSIHRPMALQDTAWSRGSEEAVRWLGVGAVAPSWEGVSAFIFEPVQGANGYVPLPPDWLRELEASARRAGVVVIADEIQSGFHRHGEMSVARSLGLSPDILLFSKSLTNGTYPLSAVVYQEALVDGPDQPFLAHTFQTGVTGYYAARAVARFLETHPVDEYCETVAGGLRGTADRLSRVATVSDLVVLGPTLSFGLPDAQARRVARGCFDHGVVVGTGGRDHQRLRVAPPITTPLGQLDEALAILEDIVVAGGTLGLRASE